MQLNSPFVSEFVQLSSFEMFPEAKVPLPEANAYVRPLEKSDVIGKRGRRCRTDFVVYVVV